MRAIPGLSRLLPELPGSVWRVIGVNAAMSVVFNFVSIFVNLYWWNQGEAILAVSLFNLLATVALFVAYLTGSYYLWRKDIRFVMLLSSAAAALTFLGLFVYQPAWRLEYLMGIGLAFGLAQGFFWAANNASMYTVLKAEQWADYFSVNTVVGQALAVVIPLVSAGLVSGIGFRGSFLAMLGVVGLAAWVSMRLPHQGLSENLFQHVRPREIFHKPGIPWVMVVVLASGVINQFLTLFSMLYIFTVSNNVGIVAVLNIGYSLALLGALVVYRRARLSQDAWLVLGVGLVLASYAVAFWGGDGRIALITVLLMRLGGLYVSGASGRQRYRVVMQGDVLWRTRLGLWMEVPFAVSRCAILTGAMFVSRLGDSAFMSLTLVSMAAMVALPLFTRLAVHRYEKEYGVGAGLGTGT